jgi:hypothetical protein
MQFKRMKFKKFLGILVTVNLALMTFACKQNSESSDARSNFVESSGEDSKGARVQIPEGSSVVNEQVEITDGDQETSEQVLQAQFPEDVTASYLIGNATYISVSDAPLAEVLTLQALLPLEDKNGLPVPLDREKEIFISYNSIDADGNSVSGIITQQPGSLEIITY